MEKEKEKLNKFAEDYKEKICNKLPERVHKNLQENKNRKLP